MPQANIWIDKDNWEQWQGLQDKSRFVNTMLVRSAVNGGGVTATEGYAPMPNKLIHDSSEFCKHDAVKGFCKKGCK